MVVGISLCARALASGVSEWFNEKKGKKGLSIADLIGFFARGLQRYRKSNVAHSNLQYTLMYSFVSSCI
jgi:hypothetical protein